MMKLVILCGAFFWAATSLLHGGEARLTFEQVKARLDPNHPRLFISKDDLPKFRARANGVCREYLQEMKKRVDALPDIPRFEIKNPAAHFDGEKVTFSKMLNDQNATEYAFKNYGGYEAAACAILYHATGDRKYLEKSYRYMIHLVNFCKIAENSRILPEWYLYGRLCGLFAYDMLYNDLTEAQRKAFIVPLLKHLQFMRKPGFTRNNGGWESGNYGERGLWWFAGIAAAGDGYADDLAEKFLEDGWNLNRAMMDYRDRVSGGKGLLTSICTGYSFAAYPWATNHFLLSLKTACDLDGTRYWVQPRDYANYFNWMMIPHSTIFDGALGDYGWGDAFHVTNILPTGVMYNHLAYIIHFYGENPRVRALINMLPEHQRRIMNRTTIPWTAFVLTNFDPSIKFTGNMRDVLTPSTAEFFPSFGLLNMRSGVRDGDTFASIKAGALESGHQHYDELSFVIFKNGFQAMNTGNRGLAPHHLVYYAQTIAHNSLLIRMPNEPLAPYWYPLNAPKVDRSKVFNDGGQNRQKAGKNLGVDMSSFHAATAGDATACYSGLKCKEAVRHFVYIKPDYFIVYDRLTSVKPDQEKVFLLHSQRKPEYSNGVWKSRGGDGMLFLKTVLPQNSKTQLIGGPGKEFMVQGVNYPLPEMAAKQAARRGGIENTWLGGWRMEVTPAKPDCQTRFLTVMQASNNQTSAMVPVENISNGDFDGVRFTTAEGITVTTRFRRNGKIQGFLKLEKAGKVLLDKALNAPADVMPPQIVVTPGKKAKLPADAAKHARLDLYLNGEKTALRGENQGTAKIFDAERWMQSPTRSGFIMTFPFSGMQWEKHQASIRVTGNGVCQIQLKGPDVRKNGQFQKIFVDYRQISVNGKVLYDGKDRFLSIWHNSRQNFSIPVKDGDILNFEIQCRPAAVQK